MRIDISQRAPLPAIDKSSGEGKRIDNNGNRVEKSTEIATIAELHLYLAVHTIVMARSMYLMQCRWRIPVHTNF